MVGGSHTGEAQKGGDFQALPEARRCEYCPVLQQVSGASIYCFIYIYIYIYIYTDMYCYLLKYTAVHCYIYYYIILYCSTIILRRISV